jgi:putative Holliday junction resolvase
VRYLGVDPGGKRVGLAVGDDTTGVVSPLEIVPYEGVERAARKIAELAAKVGAARVVLGLPTREDGSQGPAARRSERLAEALTSLGIDIALQSEFLSTDEARRRARAAGRPSRRAVDDIAAQVLLEEYIATRSAAPAAES